ncbi:hypothetical protein NGM37_07940, partial [Streptomyces sp. TRM76130]|nr:hypothetical protein [Streptomyces sp. TRM76130]
MGTGPGRGGPRRPPAAAGHLPRHAAAERGPRRH